MKKYVTAGEDTDMNIAQCMCIVCWVTKATDTHSEYVALLLFHGNSGYTYAPHCYNYVYIAGLVCLKPE